MTKAKTAKPASRSNSNKAMTEALTGVLADTFVLFVNTQTCHWNVVGPHFAALHDLFGTQYEELHAAVDELAERLRALDAKAPVGVGALKDMSVVSDGLGKGNAMGMIAALAEGHEKAIKRLSAAIDLADDVDDVGTEDLLTGRLEAHQKTLWMLKSHLE